jgi:DNA-binding transcriptional MerR regulator
MNFSTLAQLLDVDPSTVRRWASVYKEFFSPSSRPAQGKSRALTDHDVRVISLISSLRDAGLDLEGVRKRLNEMQADNWNDLPSIPDEWQRVAGTIPLDVAQARAGEMMTIAALQMEVKHLTAALESAQKRVDDLVAELQAKGALEAENTRLQLELSEARGAVQKYEAQLAGYSLGRSKPLNIGVLLLVAALVGAALVTVAIIVGALLG